MDKKKERTLEEVRKSIGIQLQDRRHFLNCILNIKNSEISIELKKQHIEHMKSQIASGQVTEQDRSGHVMDIAMLKREVKIAEFQLNQLELSLDYAKEDLYYTLHVNEGILAKAGGTLEDVKDKINAHFLMVREEYEKIKKVMNDAI